MTFGRIGADEATVIEVSRCAAVEATRQEQTPESSTDPIVGYAERLAGGAHATSGTTGRVTSVAERSTTTVTRTTDTATSTALCGRPDGVVQRR